MTKSTILKKNNNSDKNSFYAIPHETTNENIIDIYSNGAVLYDDFYAHFFSSIASKDLITSASELFSDTHLSPESRILEIGVGTGMNLDRYPKNSAIVGIDICDAMLSIANHRKTELPERDIKLLKMDATHMDFAPHSFDIVVSTLILCVAVNPMLILSEAARVLRHGGILLFLEYQIADTAELRSIQYMLSETFRKHGLLYKGKSVIAWNLCFDMEKIIREFSASFKTIIINKFHNNLLESIALGVLKRL